MNLYLVTRMGPKKWKGVIAAESETQAKLTFPYDAWKNGTWVEYRPPDLVVEKIGTALATEPCIYEFRDVKESPLIPTEPRYQVLVSHQNI
ncbi:hypothetical protein TA3x_004250 [Tundrisphaera sp. TA3]|uniref:hypothetical protein n=1 Tax=Tundrisphaera sp. TA3 TaxID=3435775 RepID=UPI003EBD3A25